MFVFRTLEQNLRFVVEIDKPLEIVTKFQFYLFLEQNLHFVFSIDKGVANAIVWYVYDTKWEKGALNRWVGKIENYVHSIFWKKSNKGIISIDSSLCFALDMICYFSTLLYQINSEIGINVTLKSILRGFF